MILHHYELSPFAEKVRLAFGHKSIAWSSVEVPIWPPRPDTVPLTAGYRRVPVLQIGADVYCDTLRILAEIERRVPEPTLYPGGQRALVTALGFWADRTLLLPAVTIATSIMGDSLPEAFIRDRIALIGRDFRRAASLRALPVERQRAAVQMRLLADMLADGRAFLLGEALSAADLSAFHVLWFVRQNGGAEAEALLPFGPLRAWMERVAACGHGHKTDMDPAEALEIARSSEPLPVAGVAGDDPSGLPAGTLVDLRADGVTDPVRGVLVGADATEIVIRHETERAGTVHVHFPRFGYGVVAAGGDPNSHGEAR